MVLGLPHFRKPSYNWVTVLEDTWSHLPIIGLICFYIYTVYTLWLFNIAMENGPFMDDCPTKTSIYKGFSIAMLNYQRVYIYIYTVYIYIYSIYVHMYIIHVYVYIYIYPHDGWGPQPGRNVPGGHLCELLENLIALQQKLRSGDPRASRCFLTHLMVVEPAIPHKNHMYYNI